MRRVIAILLVSVLLLSFGACGKQKNQAETTTKAEETLQVNKTVMKHVGLFTLPMPEYTKIIKDMSEESQSGAYSRLNVTMQVKNVAYSTTYAKVLFDYISANSDGVFEYHFGEEPTKAMTDFAQMEKLKKDTYTQYALYYKKGETVYWACVEGDSTDDGATLHLVAEPK